jgi:drug/metabolite transporter (DMT)-like permease
LALIAAVVYSTYLLTSEGLVGRVGPLTLSALVCTGAAATLTIADVVDGDLDLGSVRPAGYAWLAAIAVVSTVVSVGLLFAGIRRVGPTAASILSTTEPLVTVLLAFLAFGESLGAVQLLGGALVLGAAVLLSLRARTPLVETS